MLRLEELASHFLIVLREDSAMDHLILAAAILGLVVFLDAGFVFVLGRTRIDL